MVVSIPLKQKPSSHRNIVGVSKKTPRARALTIIAKAIRHGDSVTRWIWQQEIMVDSQLMYSLNRYILREQL